MTDQMNDAGVTEPRQIQVARMINVLALFALVGVLAGSLHLQFGIGEQPCPLCLAAALWARVDRVVFAADRDDAARAGFDDRAFYDLLHRDPSLWPMPVLERRIPTAEAPMDAWLACEGRVEY